MSVKDATPENVNNTVANLLKQETQRRLVDFEDHMESASNQIADLSDFYNRHIHDLVR